MPIANFERILATYEEDPSQAASDGPRRAYSAFLHSTLEPAESARSIGEMLQLIANEQLGSKEIAVATVRALAIQGLLPTPTQENKIARSVVSLVERHLPETVKFYFADRKAQTHEKYSRIEAIHQSICSTLLSDLQSLDADFKTITRSRQKIFNAINHVVLREYCEPFGWNLDRDVIQKTLDIFNTIDIDASSFPEDCKECERVLSELDSLCATQYSFLSRRFVGPFLFACRQAFQSFLVDVRGRTAVEIESRIPDSRVLMKRLPLHQTARTFLISIPLANIGPGAAMDLRCEIEVNEHYLKLEANRVALGTVPPGAFSCTFTASVVEPCMVADFIVTVEWTSVGSRERQTLILDACIEAQRTDIDWDTVSSQRPYSTDVAKGEAFVGRQEAVKLLANRLLRNPMESCYISGQKRVGKTSLAYAAGAYALQHSPIGQFFFDLVLWGEIANVDSRASIGALGDRFAELLLEDLPPELSRNQALNFDGTLSPLIRLARQCAKYAPNKKYVLAIDEFDEIHPDLYYAGNLAETFFANIRALTTCENLCFILIGGENMPFVMERQGQKLNKFIPIKVDYFSRADEWDDYKELVRRPTVSCVNWHEEGISEVFNLTNGNPFFTNIVCGAVFENVVEQRDADVTSDDVRRATDRKIAEIEANSFSHLWEDGIPKEKSQREADVVRRRGVLAAVAKAMRLSQVLSLENIKKSKVTLSLNDTDVLPTLNDFVRRDVLQENSGIYSFKLPLFARWVGEVGPTRLMPDPLSEELAAAAVARDERAFVGSRELIDLTEGWPTYQGRKIGPEAVRAWLDQVQTNEDRRLLFTLLRGLKFYHEGEIRGKLRMIHGHLLRHIPQFVRRSPKEMRRDVVVLYVDGEGKSGQWYASKYAEENFISTSNILSASAFHSAAAAEDARLSSAKALVIVDDVIGSGSSLAANLTEFLSKNGVWLKEHGTVVFVAVIVATSKGLEYASTKLRELDCLEIEVRACDIVDDADLAFSESSRIWPCVEDREKAKALCIQLGERIYPKAPLGFAGLGMLVAFPDTCPNTTVPILHSQSRGNKPGWQPLLLRLANG